MYFLVVYQNSNYSIITILIVFMVTALWLVGKIDNIVYMFPYLEKKKRRTKKLDNFRENFDTLRRVKGLDSSEYRKAEIKLNSLENLVKGTKFSNPNQANNKLRSITALLFMIILFIFLIIKSS